MKNWVYQKIKKWLNINTYCKFEDLNILQLYLELWARTLFFKSYRKNFEAKALMRYFEKFSRENPL